MVILLPLTMVIMIFKLSGRGTGNKEMGNGNEKQEIRNELLD